MKLRLFSGLAALALAALLAACTPAAPLSPPFSRCGQPRPHRRAAHPGHGGGTARPL